MAESIIPQSFSKCNSIMDIASFLMESCRNADIMAALAIQRGNEQARDIFAAHGGDIFFDNVNLTPTSTLASFLGVNHQYLKNLLQRCGFRYSKMSEDYRRDYLFYVLRDKQLYEILDDENKGVFVRNKTREQNVWSETDGKQIFVSPRAALCMCFIMKYGQRIPKKSMAMQILRDCENGSFYGVEAEQIYREKKCKTIDNTRKQPSSDGNMADLARVSDKNDIKMTQDFFASIFKEFSREFATAFSAEFCKVYLAMLNADITNEKQHSTIKLRKRSDN